MSDERYVIKFRQAGYPYPYVRRVHREGTTSNVTRAKHAYHFSSYAEADRARRHLIHKGSYVSLPVDEAEAIEIAHALTNSS